MRIAIVTSVWPPHRVPEADYAWHLAHHLASRGHSVQVITGQGASATNS